MADIFKTLNENVYILIEHHLNLFLGVILRIENVKTTSI